MELHESLILKFFCFVCLFWFPKESNRKTVRLEKAQPSDNAVVWKKKSIISILILIAIYTYCKGKKIKIYNHSWQDFQFITSLSRPYIVLYLWWNRSTVKTLLLYLELTEIKKNLKNMLLRTLFRRSTSLLSLSAFVSGQATMSTQVPSSLWKLGRLNHVAIATPDLLKSVSLYRDIMGAAVRYFT